MTAVYESLTEKAKNNKTHDMEPEQSLIILDDCMLEISFGGTS